MTKPKDDDVKRYWVEHGRGRLTAIYEEKVDGLDDDAFEVIRAADHDRKVAELYESEAVKLGHIEDLEMQVCRLESKLATARKVIEKLREQRNKYIQYTPLSSDLAQHLDAEIEAIEPSKRQGSSR